MSKLRFLDFIDNVMSNIDAPGSQKISLENELIRYILDASENAGIEEVKGRLGSPEKLAEELTKRLPEYKTNAVDRPNEDPGHDNYHVKSHHRRYAGEFMQERSNVNIKLLYIPLLQLSSGTTRVIMPLEEDDD